MRALFEFLKQKIEADAPAIVHIEMYNNQDIREKTDGSQMAYPTPAVFIDFEINETTPLSDKIVLYDMNIRFRFNLQGYTFTRLDDMDFVNGFQGVMTNFRGVDTDPVQFSSLEHITERVDNDFDQINAPEVVYRTSYRNTEFYTAKATKAIQGFNVNIDE